MKPALSLAAQIGMGQPVTTWVPIAVTALAIPVLFWIAMWRFQKEEFY